MLKQSAQLVERFISNECLQEFFIIHYVYIYIYILLGIQSTLLGRLYRKREQLIENSWKFTLSFQSRYFRKNFHLKSLTKF